MPLLDLLAVAADEDLVGAPVVGVRPPSGDEVPGLAGHRPGDRPERLAPHAPPRVALRAPLDDLVVAAERHGELEQPGPALESGRPRGAVRRPVIAPSTLAA
jgi:hypothetical protein